MNEAALALTASVVMHVAWNLLARHQPANTFALWWALGAHLLILGLWGLPTLIADTRWTAEFAALLALSAAANGVYFVALRRAYSHAPVALVYPVVRSSPLLIALWGMLLFGDSLSAMVWAGIVVSVAGLLLMASGDHRGGEGKAVPWALVAWLALGIEHRRTQGRWLPAARPAWYVILAGGLCVGLAYALVIHAMRFMPAAEAVAYTNAGIVLACLASIVVFRERQFWQRRLTGAGIILSGLMLMRFAS